MIMFIITRNSGAAVLNTDGSLAIGRDHFEAIKLAARLDAAHGHAVHTVQSIQGEILGLVLKAANRIADKTFAAPDVDTWEGTVAAVRAAAQQ
jgi:hypothetical protein